MVVADAPGSKNAGEDTVSKNGIAGKEELVIGLIEADAAGGVTGGVHDLEPVVAEINHGVPFEVNVGTNGFRKAVKVFAHHDKLVLQLDLVSCQTVGGKSGCVKEEGTGPDVVKMFMGQDDEVDIFRLQLDFFEAVFKVREISSDTCINENVLCLALDQVDMAAGPVHPDLVDVRPELHYLFLSLHFCFLFAGFLAFSTSSFNRVSYKLHRSLIRWQSSCMMVSAKAGCWLTR